MVWCGDFALKKQVSFFEWIFDVVCVLLTYQQTRILCSGFFSVFPAHLLKLSHVHIILIPKFVMNNWTKFPSLIGCGETQYFCKIFSKPFGNCLFCGKFFYFLKSTYSSASIKSLMGQSLNSCFWDVRIEPEYDWLALEHQILPWWLNWEPE